MRATGPHAYVVDDEPSLLDLDVIHGYLVQSYWSPGVPRGVVERSLANSLVVGLYSPDGHQVGMARAVTDGATFAWIADVFVLPEHRGRGLGVFVVSALLDHPDLIGLRRVMLATADAHDLYHRFGLAEITDPERYLVLKRSPSELYRS